MTVQLSIRQVHGVHKGGTKEYTLTLVEGSMGKLLFRAWGPVGKSGDGKIELAKEDTLDAAVKDRRKGGYDMKYQPVSKITPDKLPAYLTRKHLTLLTDGYLSFLHEDLKLTDVPGAGGGSHSERAAMTDAILKATEEKRREEARVKAAAEEAEQAAALEEMKNAPFFGMF
ncbi:hypothetical protein [Paracoccus litorisediminis]|uniref:Uncharacterized protein n=1 Tax=Paracoccus litorisediminis TaxID=2006130 RepID=A0A844HU93_9RHOB|nr:hypothetical protein [Paracoccus litorisediminis]MTH61082.1 hypothetical protein [Paracoccus litorisediminis]